MKETRGAKRDPAQVTLFMIWVAQLVVPLILLAIAILKPPVGSPTIGNLEQTLTFAALVMTAMAWFVPKLIARAQVKIKNEPIREVGDLMKTLTPAFLVRWSLLEGLAILGFLLVILGNPIKRSLPLFAVSLIGLIINRPSPEKAKSLLQ